MPELPEVEVTRRGIAGPLAGARVHALRLGKPLRWPLGHEPAALAGTTVGEISRRGKYLWLPLWRAGVAEGGLLMHLGMSGSLALQPEPGPPGPHDHFDLVTDRGTLRLNDPRRFGAVVWSASLGDAPAATLLARLGPEPFDPELTPQRFHAALKTRRAPVKAVLLAGDAVVGAGNIYACEALFQAGIHPAARLHRRARRQRRLPGPGRGLRPRGPALPALRRARAPPCDGAALDVLLRRLPEALAAGRRPALSAAVTVCGSVISEATRRRPCASMPDAVSAAAPALPPADRCKAA